MEHFWEASVRTPILGRKKKKSILLAKVHDFGFWILVVIAWRDTVIAIHPGCL